ncbi:MAG: 3'-5' exoribonuclease [Blastocatellia bacterium]
MRYWYDTEFIEDGHTIDLISIGMVAEDGREYYAVSSDFSRVRMLQNQWLVDNVVPHLPARKVDQNRGWDWANFQEDFASGLWKRRPQIKLDLLEFCDRRQYGKPEFWGYFSAYDHVALCQLFGTMMDLPREWPMYTRDIEQLRDSLGNPALPAQPKNAHDALADARWTRDAHLFLLQYQQRQ